MDKEDRNTAGLYFSLAMFASRMYLYVYDISMCDKSLYVLKMLMSKLCSSWEIREPLGDVLEISLDPI